MAVMKYNVYIVHIDDGLRLGRIGSVTHTSENEAVAAAKDALACGTVACDYGYRFSLIGGPWNVIGLLYAHSGTLFHTANLLAIHSLDFFEETSLLYRLAHLGEERPTVKRLSIGFCVRKS